MTPPPVVMIHGAFCGGWVFDDFRQPFEAAGHAVLTPDLPGRGEGASAAGLSMRDYAADVARIAEAQAAPPILIGHSLGGLVAAMAAARTPTAGVILLAPSAPWGVSGSTMEEAISAVALYALGPYWALALEPEYVTFSRYSVDRLPSTERHALFARMRPESGLAIFETLNWWLDPFMTTQVRSERIGAPILALSGGRDAVHPPATVAESARRLGATHRTLPEMSHWLPGEPGWDEVARLCLAWLAEQPERAAAE